MLKFTSFMLNVQLKHLWNLIKFSEKSLKTPTPALIKYPSSSNDKRIPTICKFSYKKCEKCLRYYLLSHLVMSFMIEGHVFLFVYFMCQHIQNINNIKILFSTILYIFQLFFSFSRLNYSTSIFQYLNLSIQKMIFQMFWGIVSFPD